MLLLNKCRTFFSRGFNLRCRKQRLFLSFVQLAVRALEKAKGNTQLQTNYSSDSSLYTNRKGSAVSAFDGGSDSSSESESDETPNRKKLRLELS